MPHLAFLLCSLFALDFALLVRHARDLVLELTAERACVCAFSFALCAWGKLIILPRWLLVLFIIGVCSCNVLFAHGIASSHRFLLDTLALFTVQRAQIFVIVVRMCPDASRRVLFRVDVELVLVAWVV